MTPAEIAAVFERYRVVGVLDAWAALDGHYIEQATYGTDIKLWGPFGKRGGRDFKRFEGATFDLARAAAARAIESGEV